MSSVKPKVSNVSQRRQRRTEPRSSRQHSHELALWFSSYASGQTDVGLLRAVLRSEKRERQVRAANLQNWFGGGLFRFVLGVEVGGRVVDGRRVKTCTATTQRVHVRPRRLRRRVFCSQPSSNRTGQISTRCGFRFRLSLEYTAGVHSRGCAWNTSLHFRRTYSVGEPN